MAGVCCAEELCRLCPQDSVVLVSADRVLKVRCGAVHWKLPPLLVSPYLAALHCAWGID